MKLRVVDACNMEVESLSKSEILPCRVVIRISKNCETILSCEQVYNSHHIFVVGACGLCFLALWLTDNVSVVSTTIDVYLLDSWHATHETWLTSVHCTCPSFSVSRRKLPLTSESSVSHIWFIYITYWCTNHIISCCTMQ